MLIDAVQFIRPNGAQRWGQIEIDDKLENKVKICRDNNVRVEMEVLTTGEVSVTLSHPEGDIFIRIVENGPKVKDAIEDMYKEITEDKISDFVGLERW